ncbi:MAG: molybdate-binding protein, partial [Acidimicrobiia bacterium]|nr:molybdate-binding protein [Acidimicrobiia bacterium]
GADDAGIVYESDVVGAESSVQAVAIPADVNITARYPIAALTNSTHLADARRFVDYVTSTSGRATLIDFGFGEP